MEILELFLSWIQNFLYEAEKLGFFVYHENIASRGALIR